MLFNWNIFAKYSKGGTRAHPMVLRSKLPRISRTGLQPRIRLFQQERVAPLSLFKVGISHIIIIRGTLNMD